MDYKKYDDSNEGNPSYEGTQYDKSEDKETERLSYPRCLSAVPEDVLEMIDDESESESE